MKYAISFMIFFSLSCNAKANFTMDAYVDEFINVDAKGYYLKILTPESNADNIGSCQWNRPNCSGNGLFRHDSDQNEGLCRPLENKPLHDSKSQAQASKLISARKSRKADSQMRADRLFFFDNQQKPPCYNTDNSINVRPSENGNAIFRRFC